MTLVPYGSATLEDGSRPWGLEEALKPATRGSLRMGPRRGFHVLLSQERPDGFEPILPG